MRKVVVLTGSLQVYPAAGLLHYVPPMSNKCLIDKNIPDVGYLENLHSIQKMLQLEWQNYLRYWLKISNDKVAQIFV